MTSAGQVDVYKRQTIAILISNVINPGIGLDMSSLQSVDVTAVSYTHLDVYKRQAAFP